MHLALLPDRPALLVRSHPLRRPARGRRETGRGCRYSEPTLKTALSVLELVVGETCQELTVTLLSEEVRVLRQQVNGAAASPLQRSIARRRRALAEHLARHEGRDARATCSWTGPSLISKATFRTGTVPGDRRRRPGMQPEVSHDRFTRIAGDHLHSYLITLRVSHACRLLLGSDSSIKQSPTNRILRTGPSGTRFPVPRRRLSGEYRRIFESR